LKLYWLASALRDRRAIFNHIAQDRPAAAAALDKRFVAVAEILTRHPEMGRQGIVSGTREVIPHPNYRMVYEVEADVVRIMAIVHTSRLWP